MFLKRVGWNEYDGGKFSKKLINILFLINVLVGKFEMSINANWKQISDLAAHINVFF